MAKTSLRPQDAKIFALLAPLPVESRDHGANKKRCVQAFQTETVEPQSIFPDKPGVKAQKSLFLLSVALISCTEGKPVLQGGNVPIAPTLDSSAVALTSPTASFLLSGKCDPRMDSIWYSTNDGSTWQNLTTVSGATATCKATKSFSATFDLSDSGLSSQFGFTQGVVSKKTVSVRAQTAIGPTKSASMAVRYEPAAPAGSVDRVILSGTSPQKELTSPSFRLQGRIGLPVSGGPNTSSPSSMTIKRSLQQ